MSLATEIETERRLTELEDYAKTCRRQILEMSEIIAGTAELILNLQRLVSTLAVDAPEKVDPIKIPKKPRVLREMFPDPPEPAA